MTSTELKERLENAKANVEKCKKIIEKHSVTAEKNLKKFEETGDNEYRYRYEVACDDKKTATYRLNQLEKTAKNWEEKYNKEVERELLIANQVPEAFKQARKQLVSEWTAFDMAEKERMANDKKSLSKEDFRLKYSYSKEEYLHYGTEEKFHKENENEANIWIINLYNKVVKLTGEIIDATNLKWGGKGLDGFIIGEKTKVRVETIAAGGYNIQKLHLRTLLHKVGK